MPIGLDTTETAHKLARPTWWGVAQKIRWLLPNHKLDIFLGCPQKAITRLRDKLPCAQRGRAG